MDAEVIDLNQERVKRQMSDRQFCQVAALMKLYWMAHLRFAATVGELVDWSRGMFPAGVDIDPSSVLTRAEMDAAATDALHERARLLTEHVLTKINL